jgi:hypothetical protein
MVYESKSDYLELNEEDELLLLLLRRERRLLIACSR